MEMVEKGDDRTYQHTEFNQMDALFASMCVILSLRCRWPTANNLTKKWLKRMVVSAHHMRTQPVEHTNKLISSCIAY